MVDHFSTHAHDTTVFVSEPVFLDPFFIQHRILLRKAVMISSGETGYRLPIVLQP
jgi:hypothetical protein